MNTRQNCDAQTPELCDTKNGDLCDRELWTWIWSDKSGEDSLIQMHIYNFIQTILPSIQDKKLFKSDILWNPFTPKSD